MLRPRDAVRGSSLVAPVDADVPNRSLPTSMTVRSSDSDPALIRTAWRALTSGWVRSGSAPAGGSGSRKLGSSFKSFVKQFT